MVRGRFRHFKAHKTDGHFYNWRKRDGLFCAQIIGRLDDKGGRRGDVRMKLAWALTGLLALAACAGSPPPERDPQARPAMGGDDVKDHTMPLNAAEPPWRDIIRHTVLPLPGKAMHPAPSPDGAFFAYATSEFGPKLQIAVR